MGHDIGVSASYYKPTEREVLEDYLKAVDLLTINGDKVVLKKQVAELNEKSKNNEYIIRGKLEEKDEQIKTIQTQLQTLIAAVGNMNSQSGKQDVAKHLIEKGMYKHTNFKSG